MQVNKCTEPKQSFGMALKISKEPTAIKALKNMSKVDLENLGRAGEELKDTKFYHMEINDKGERVISSVYSGSDKYYGGTFKFDVPKDKSLRYYAQLSETKIKNWAPGDTIRRYLEFANKKAAQDAYIDLIKTNQGIDRDVKMIKYLDSRAIEIDNVKKAEAAMEAQKKADEAAKNNLVNKLLDKFGE